MVIVDKSENNPVKRKNGWPGISAEYDLRTNKFRVLDLGSNTFCSAVETGGAEPDKGTQTSSGFLGIRLWTPCVNNQCNWVEKTSYLSSARWYNTLTTLPDGRVFILSGCTAATAINTVAYQNPTYEFFPKDNTPPGVPFDFLLKTFPFDLYPHVVVLPYGTRLFIFSGTKACVWDYRTKKYILGPNDIPALKGPPRTYPLTGTGLLLPLTYENNYRPDFMICGGGQKYGDMNAVADNTCGRIDLSVAKPTWDMDTFVIPRVMGDGVCLADGKILFVNGAGKGYAGYTDNPVLIPLLYDPNPATPKNKRWTRLTGSKIARMYHSVANLLPDGTVFITGSNPNGNYRKNDGVLKYPTEYRVEIFTPPYLLTNTPRPNIVTFAGVGNFNQINPVRIGYGKTFTVRIRLPVGVKPVITSAVINLGFQTHSVHMSQRYVKLQVAQVNNGGNGYWNVNIRMVPRSNVMTPGRCYVYLLHAGKPANTAVEIMLG
ncbi:5242_t:CDS:2 [Diversispora eburnea]|uniref:5242_t:CDS:1 n=1 Tax=Diversispora eburnea TaxID=1213867 RepID=A0A9N9BUA7_9GLOM|nr:5242_t:CDS:2 [Diversispora eburnea]